MVFIWLCNAICALKTGIHLYEYLGLREFLSSDFCKTWFKSLKPSMEKEICVSLDLLAGLIGIGLSSSADLDKKHIELEKICQQYEDSRK